MSLTPKDMEELANRKVELLKKFLSAEPPSDRGEDLIELWREIYDDELKSAVIETATGPSDDITNPVLPYEKLYCVVGDGGNWKWPRMWRRFDELQRRGPAYREGDPLNFGLPNPNPHIVAQSVLVVGGGPVGLRLAIQLKLGGHRVTVFEKRREVRDENGQLQTLGFTNRINRPHVFTFLRNDLDRLNGRDFMSSKMCYPVFTQADTSSIGIDELQMLLLKNALMLGVDVRVGVSFDDAEVSIDARTQKPRWKVLCTVDEKAASQYDMDLGTNSLVFDVLMGSDGARSRVRESQATIFGEVDKRNFKKMVGVVSNVQKISRKRLKELGFESGQEPTDIKRAHRSSTNSMTGLNYYKASYHNYVIFTPSKDDLERAGLSGKLYSFLEGRSQASQAQAEEKARLKKWVLARCKEVGIPVDETLPNDGFVPAPNDVMAFDFSEIWKCKKNFAFNIPPLEYLVEEQGPWSGKSLIPPIGLVGDAVTEPFWIAGVGLQRGWNGIMDACYVIDNLYNMTFSGEPDAIPSTTWDDHVQRLQKMLPLLYDCAHDGRMTKEGLQGEHADQGVVMTQLARHCKDPEKPQWQLDVDPFTRYEPLAKLQDPKYKGAKALENIHPVVRRTMAIKKVPAEGVVCSKKLVSVCGKQIQTQTETTEHHNVSATTQRKWSDECTGSGAAAPDRQPIPESEVIKVASSKNENLQSMLVKQIDVHVQQTRAASTADRRSTPFIDEAWKELPAESGFAELAETAWDVMTEKHLGPVQKVELVHVRNMMNSLKQQISALTNSLEAYKRAEREILLAAEPKVPFPAAV